MSATIQTPPLVSWLDISVEDPDRLQEFYSKILGLESEGFSYSPGNTSYNLKSASGETVAGVCHLEDTDYRPKHPHWMVYFPIEGIEAKIEEAVRMGAKVLLPLQSAGGYGKYAVLEDPAGAAFSLFEKA